MKIFIKPSNTAIIITDMQCGFISDNPIIPINNATNIIKNINDLIALARTFNIQIIWTRASHNNMLIGEYKNLNPEHFDVNGNPIFTKESDYFKIIDELRPMIRNNDIFIDKDRFSAFYQTNLELILRQNKIDTILFSGVTTNICIESSIRDAFERDFRAILLSDCSTSLNNKMHEFSIELIKLVFGYVLILSEFRAILNQELN